MGFKFRNLGYTHTHTYIYIYIDICMYMTPALRTQQNRTTISRSSYVELFLREHLCRIHLHKSCAVIGGKALAFRGPGAAAVAFPEDRQSLLAVAQLAESAGSVPWLEAASRPREFQVRFLQTQRILREGNHLSISPSVMGS